MKIGTDGNMWYCSNGMCLGDPRAEFVFEPTLRESITAYQKKFGGSLPAIPDELSEFLDKSPDEYRNKHKDNVKRRV